jgi:C4-dicarboxylate-specific signal transduction histidine kinase
LPQPHSPVEAVADALATDLREPAGVVRARAEALRYELQERGQVADFMPELSRLLHAADRLDDVRLTLAVLAGSGAAAGAATDVAEVAREVKEALAPMLQRDNVRIELEAPARLQAVGASHNEMRLVLVRLLDAARRAAAAAGRPALVLTSVRREGDGVVLEIADTLPMPAESDPQEQPAWFDPAWSPAERPTLGLALSVSRIIVERRGGRFDVARSAGNGLAVRIVMRAADKVRPITVGSRANESPPAAAVPRPPAPPAGSRPRRALARGWDALTRAGRGR